MEETSPILLHTNLLGVGKPSRDLSFRMLAPSIVVRTGPAVLVTGEARLAEMTVPVVVAQGSTALWWDPSGTMEQPHRTQAVTWEPLSGITSADTALAFAGELLGVTSMAAGAELPLGERPARVLGALLLAARLGSGSAAQAGAWLSWGPGSWGEAVGILEGSAEDSARPLATELDSALHNAGEWLDTDTEGLFGHIGAALTLMAPMDGALRRPLFIRPFLSSGSDVLFVALPADRAVAPTVAASVLIGRIARLHRHLSRRAAPLAFLIDSPEATLAVPRMAQLLRSGPEPRTVWASVTSRPPQRHRQDRWPACLRVTRGRDATLSLGRHRKQVTLPRFSEPPWSLVASAARGVLGSTAIRHLRNVSRGPSTLAKSDDPPRRSQ